jgi:hypothetical protein
MYYRVNDNVVKEMYTGPIASNPSIEHFGFNFNKESKFPTWLLIVIIVTIGLAAICLLYKLFNKRRNRNKLYNTSNQKFGYKFY